MQLTGIEDEEERMLTTGGSLQGSMVGRRRVATTRAVGEAWERFSLKRAEVIRKAFRIVGLSVPVDGSEDQEISVKGLATDFLKGGLVDLRIGGEVEADDHELVEEDEDEIGFSDD